MDFSRVFFRFDGSDRLPLQTFFPQRLAELRSIASRVINLEPRALFEEVKTMTTSLGTGARAVLVSKGCIAGIALYLLRYESVARAFKNFCIVGAAGVGLWLNFHLDMEREICARGITIGVSRLVLLGVCYLILRSAPRGLGPLCCGIASQVVPRAMYAMFKAVYLAVMALLRFFNRDTPLPLSGLAQSIAVEETCCICMDNVCDYTTNCAHHFHQSCLQLWAERCPRCPLCNTVLSYKPALCQKMKNWFILDFVEWKRLHRMCGDWWQESFFN